MNAEQFQIETLETRLEMQVVVTEADAAADDCECAPGECPAAQLLNG
ncbi:MAG TPA: hypothetical protein PK413_06360 [Thermoanaerobaculia bacterium]|nr:hypothetical protein [Thermoanaerobaculia bacterium]